MTNFLPRNNRNYKLCAGGGNCTTALCIDGWIFFFYIDIAWTTTVLYSILNGFMLLEQATLQRLAVYGIWIEEFQHFRAIEVLNSVLLKGTEPYLDRIYSISCTFVSLSSQYKSRDLVLLSFVNLGPQCSSGSDNISIATPWILSYLEEGSLICSSYYIHCPFTTVSSSSQN